MLENILLLEWLPVNDTGSVCNSNSYGKYLKTHIFGMHCGQSEGRSE